MLLSKLPNILCTYLCTRHKIVINCVPPTPKGAFALLFPLYFMVFLGRSPLKTYAQHYEGEHGKGDVECLLRQEIVHTAMVIHSLHQVTHEFRVKERHRQFQEFDKEIAHQ